MRMAFGNNILQSGCFVEVLEFDPPEEGGKDGSMTVHCPTEADYTELRRFVDEPHGSALKSMDGGVWYVGRIDDDAVPGLGFPQDVTVRIQWWYRFN